MDFRDAGPLVFEGEQSVGLRKFNVEIREVQNARQKRFMLRLKGVDKGGKEYWGDFLETELVEKLGILPKSKTPTASAVPKLLQRLKCKQGQFFLEGRGKSRGSTAGSSAGGSRATTATNTNTNTNTNNDNDRSGTREAPSTAGSTGSSGSGVSGELAFGQQFLRAETVELNGGGNDLFDISEMDPVGQQGEQYEMVYRKGFKITPEEQREVTAGGVVTDVRSTKNPPDRVFYGGWRCCTVLIVSSLLCSLLCLCCFPFLRGEKKDCFRLFSKKNIPKNIPVRIWLER